MSNVQIAAKLNREGNFWLNGTPWTGQRVIRHLKCELLVGRQWGEKFRAPFGESRELKNQDQWLLVRTFEPVISPRVFAAARKRRIALGGGRSKTRPEMLADLRRILKKRGRLSCALINADEFSQSADSYYDHFASLSEAYAAIGYTGSQPYRGRKPDGSAMGRDEIIVGLRQIEAMHGYVSLSLVHSTASMPSDRVIRVMFGSMPDAYEAAGVRWKRASQKKRLPGERNVA